MGFTLLKTALGLAAALPGVFATNWTTFKGNGVNLGGWLVQESTIDTAWWDANSGGATDEWGLCVHLGSQCGPVLERRYATWITPSDIDTLAASGITVLRIPTTYAAWLKVPGSQLYSGNQLSFLNNILTYAVTKYDMQIVVDIHSLPGGINGLTIGEANGHFGWFNNQTALNYSLQIVNVALNWVQHTGFASHISLEPFNEPVDNPDFSTFGTPASLSDSGAAWLLQFIKTVISQAATFNPPITIMFQGGFRPVSYWAPQLGSSTNVVFDVHNYYFAGRPTTSDNVPQFICQDATSSVEGRGGIPVFIGEWSIQAATNNTLASRKTNVNTGIQAWANAAQGGAYWTAKFAGTAVVDGEGTQADYWNYAGFVQKGFIDPTAAILC